MIISKIIINAVAGKLVKHFQLDKIMSYVFDDNELDKKLKQHDKRILKLEKGDKNG
tara:strand:- start:302 stop:469 length:168 start_codon:yes stop_codon:yes gene_type:complete